MAEVQKWRANQPVQRIDLVAARPAAPVEQRRLEAASCWATGATAARLPIRPLPARIRGRAVHLRDGQTSETGDYTLAFPGGARNVTLEVRAVTPAGEEVPLSKPLTFPGERHLSGVNLVAPAKGAAG